MDREQRLANARMHDPLRDQAERGHSKRIREARAAWLAGPRATTDVRNDAGEGLIHAAALAEMLIKLGVVQKVDFLEALAEVYERAAKEGL